MKADTAKIRLRFLLRTAALLAMLLTAVAGCAKKDAASPDAAEVVIISPHNQSIKEEFENAFREHYRTEFGEDIKVVWRDIGGGSNSILQFLQNVYSRSDTSRIDILFGGGEYSFQKLSEIGLLEKLNLPAEVLEQVPARFSGMEMYDPQMYWIGNVVSSFGFIYNKQVLAQLGITPPKKWEDLGRPEFFDLVMLADPTQSGSIAAAYEMIVQSAPDWPAGWARLLSILSNAKQFTDSSVASADAPVIGTAPVATCIDFYGSMRVEKAPDKLGFISPAGQTGFTPDPIGILKNPPQPQPARRFVNFVMSLQGQALWALPPGHPAGPERSYLNRPPIRRDFYEKYGGEIPDWIVRPYAEGSEMMVDAELRAVRFDVLVQLVRAAALDNRQQMQQAKKRLIETNFPSAKLAEFNRLPENIDQQEEIAVIHDRLGDPAHAETIVTDWIDFFREKYKRVAD